MSNIQIALVNYCTKMLIRISPPKGFVLLCFPLTIVDNTLYNGAAFNLGDTIVVKSPDICDLTINGYFSACVVILSERLLSKKLKYSLRSGAWMLSTSKVNAFVLDVLSTFSSCGITHEVPDNKRSQAYCEAIYSLFCPDAFIRYTSDTARRRIVKKVDTLLTDRYFPFLNIKYICDHLKINERSLNYAFNQYYGISPMAFVKISKLHRAKELLLEADPNETNVTEIANRLGFWQLGQFSQDYKALFNELPSDTLACPIV
ncbi:MAG: helix-turn-helix domain-containing protein [Xenococcus sp. (in: cyanobacteria)]